MLAFCMGFFLRPVISRQSADNNKVESSGNSVKMKKVTGVAGIFFKCKDPKKIKEWYKIHLGFNTDQYGASFEWQEGTDPAGRGSLQWTPFSGNTNYFSPSTKDFMINYRVENLAKLSEQLKKEGVIFTDEIETFEYGSFVHIMDIEGNKIELYEPNYNYGRTE